MANVFAILTAIVLAAAAFIASKNKSKYEAEIEARKTEDSRLVKSTARLDDLNKQFDNTASERKSTEETNVSLTETESAQKKKNSALESALSEKEAKADVNAKKISGIEDGLKELGNIEELVEKIKTTQQELAQLKDDIGSSEAKLADLTGEKSRTEGVIGSFRAKDSNYSSKHSFFSSTRISQIFPAYGFVTLPIGNSGGVVSGSPLNVVRDGAVVAKLRVSSVEAGRAAAEIVPDSLAEGTNLMVGDRVVPGAEDKK
jgi:multidrug efflux pump subunit AcrA (membrane-fusion protein)